MSERSISAHSVAHNLVPHSVESGTRLFALGALLLALFCIPVRSLLAQTPTAVTVPTWRYDLTHSGANTNETALTPANVNVNTFGKLFSMKVDSTVYAQPLYVPGLTMSDGKVHNVIFVATENDSIYAFDADSNGGANANPIWQISLLDAAHGAGAGATPQPRAATGEEDIGPAIGITGTPAINPATHTMYVVGATEENGAYFMRLHAINILTGAEQPGSPVAITATVAGTGNGSSGGELSFSPVWENQRPALDYYNGYVYVAFAAHGDLGPWHGWIFAYNATNLAQTAAFCFAPDEYGVGIWSSGAGMPIDDDAAGGRMFVATGNSRDTAGGSKITYPPFTATSELGESVVDFSLANGGLTPTDAFTSFNINTLNDGDLDLGAGGALMVPDQAGDHPHILVVAGKEGRIIVLNRDSLGGYAPGGSSNTNALQDITGQIEGCWCTPAYWNGNVYIWAQKDVAKLFQLSDGVMNTTPSSESTITSQFPSPTFSVSSNGTQDGIAWAVRSDQFNTHGAAVLYAWNANSLTTPIYESDTDPTRDAAGPANKFSIPVVTNGKVYVAANGEVDVYGLFNGEPNAAAPVISPDGGTFAATQTVTLTSTTPSADIYYTLDGTTPTPASTLYNGPITISTDTTVNAIASAPGYIQSGVTSATFNFSTQTPPVTFSPPAGTYANAQNVTISDTDANAKIYYTTDGSTPSASSNLYSGPIPVLVSETINAIAIDPALRNSDIGTAAYVIQNSGETINFANGFSSSGCLSLNGSALNTNDTRLQLTNGNPNEAASVFCKTPINVQAFTSTFEFQVSVPQGGGGGNGLTFTIQNVGPTALGADSTGLGYQGIAKSVAVKFDFYNGDDSTGIYTGGEAPTTNSVDLGSSGIELGSGDGIQVQLTYDGATLTMNILDTVTKKTYTTSWTINIPQYIGGDTAYVGFTGSSGTLSASQKLLSWTYATQSVPPAFSPAAGTYTAAQNVALSSATADAAIYYTTDGTTPSAGSTRYSAAIPVAASETVKALAISPTVGSSNVVSAAYVIQPVGLADFSLKATQPAAISPGGSATSTVTITPTSGFTGSVDLTCAVSGATGSTDVPTCTTTQPAAISGANPVTATLTISTMATSAALHNPLQRMLKLGGGGAFAALLFFCVPFRRRKWQKVLSLLVFLAIVAAVATGCGGGSSNMTGGSGGSGTSAGSYTVTVTGTSGSAKATTAVTVTVS